MPMDGVAALAESEGHDLHHHGWHSAEPVVCRLASEVRARHAAGFSPPLTSPQNAIDSEEVATSILLNAAKDLSREQFGEFVGHLRKAEAKISA